ncbi:MAG: esterase, partial [Polyangiaceae bacterium]
RTKMKEITIGNLRARITGGDDREGSGTGPVVVLLHGYGAPGEDLVPLWRVIDVPRGTRFVFPEAPLRLADTVPGAAYGEGRAWWPIDMAAIQTAMMRGEVRDMTGGVPEGSVPAREALITFIEGLPAALGCAPDRIALGGFSQGAMLATDVVLRTELPVAALVIMSGTLLADSEWTPLMARRKGLRVLQSHGREDPILPFAIAEQLRDRLTTADLDVQFVPFRGGHGIPPEVLQGVGNVLRSAFA